MTDDSIVTFDTVSDRTKDELNRLIDDMVASGVLDNDTFVASARGHIDLATEKYVDSQPTGILRLGDIDDVQDWELILAAANSTPSSASVSPRLEFIADYASSSTTSPLYISRNEIISEVVSKFSATFQIRDDGTSVYPADKALLASNVIRAINRKIARVNELRKVEKMKTIAMLDSVPFMLVGEILMKMHSVVHIPLTEETSDPDYDILAVYVSDPDSPSYGTYSTSMTALSELVRQCDPMATEQTVKEVHGYLKAKAPRAARESDRDLIPVANGIFDYKTKTLKPFSPEHVFLSKSQVDYVDDPEKPVYTYDDGSGTWDVEEWIAGLSDDPEIVNLLWEILSAIIRPGVSWDKTAWLYSQSGSNGKGTLVELMRNLCGPGAYASIPIDQFSKDFQLEPLIWASAILVDENDVGAYIERAKNLKAVITGDAISLDRKFKTPVVLKFRGFMVQCVNDFPNLKDKTGSMYRRQLFIPMEKRFIGATRRPEIKDRFMKDPRVLEYVLWKVLHETDFYVLSEPEACKALLDSYKQATDPVRDFWNQMEGQFVWDLLPSRFLFDLYISWFPINVPNGKPLGRNKFLESLKQIVIESDSSLFEFDTGVRSKNRISAPEPLISEYRIAKDWGNLSYNSSRPDLVNFPANLADRFDGFVRKP